MQSPAQPTNERERVSALKEYQILDTPFEAVYDAITRLAKDVMGTSMSAISLVEGERQWFKARAGLDIRESSRETSFCGHIVASGAPMIVGDTHGDARFDDNPLVTGDPNLRFYAGMPLTNPEGFTLGTLCVFDSAPVQVSEEQISALQSLATVLMDVLEGRRRFLSLFDAANIDVFTIDARNATVTFASRGALNRLGYSVDEITGMPIYDIAPGMQHDTFERTLASAIDGNETVTEGFLRRRDGTTYPVEIRLDAVRDGGGYRAIVVATDITARRAAQREIELLLRAVGSAGDVIIVYRVGEAGELTLSYANEAFSAQTGYRIDDALGTPLLALRQGHEDDGGFAAIREALATGQSASADIVSYRRDGTPYWNQVTLKPVKTPEGSITHWISIERDITREVERNTDLMHEHDRLVGLTRAARRIFTALDGTTLISTLTDVVERVLDASVCVYAVNEFGVAIETTTLGQNDWERGLRNNLLASSILSRGRVSDPDDHRVAIYAGRFADADYVIVAKTRDETAFVNTDLFVLDLICEYFTVAARNVSLYRELDERRSAVLELSQTKSDLIAMLAHDFRGPLTSIVGFADLTGEIGDVNEEQRDFLDTIKSSAMQLSELATDTLTLSRLERNEVALQTSDVDIAEIVRGVVARHRGRAQINVTVHGNAAVVGDEERLRQVFTNLVDNAVKYTPDGCPGPSVTIEGDESAVVVSVRDRGIGIPPGEVSRVFDRFTRASNAKQLRISGTGFGLFLTKQLVQLHGGTIAIESEEGVGSTFTVTIPRHVDRGSAPRTVALVDVEGDNSFLNIGLQERGYRAVVVTRVQDLLAVADGQRFDAILVNVADDALTGDDAGALRMLSARAKVPLVAVETENVRRLNPAVTLSRPVLIGDVFAAFDRLFAT